jgi:hypothetical protein
VELQFTCTHAWVRPAAADAACCLCHCRCWTLLPLPTLSTLPPTHPDDVEQQLEGWAPFDAIHVGAAAAQLPPALVALLKPGGRMIIPVGEQDRPQVSQQQQLGGAGAVG